ncbi:hypothetical protein VTO42DRAFT_1493 [Malbranchea cinnamomea]
MLLQSDVPEPSALHGHRMTLPQTCASFDRGGGVMLGDSFAIYSVAALFNRSKSTPTSTSTFAVWDDPALSQELQSAASALARVLPVHTTTATTGSSGPATTLDLVSLPCPSSHKRKRDQIAPVVGYPPWFLINAAIASKHCVVGSATVVESLLTVFQRPWCVLEVCCCDTQTVAAALEFASVAEKLDSRTYGAARRLLSQELSSTRAAALSAASSVWSTLARDGWDSRTGVCGIRASRLRDITEMYKALSVNGVRSHSPFWLCLIPVCAVYLGIPASELTKSLHSDTRLQQLALTASHPGAPPSAPAPAPAGSSTGPPLKENPAHGLAPRSKSSLRKPPSAESLLQNTPRPHQPAKLLNSAEYREDDEYQRRLVSLYKAILWRIRECTV